LGEGVEGSKTEQSEVVRPKILTMTG